MYVKYFEFVGKIVNHLNGSRKYMTLLFLKLTKHKLFIVNVRYPINIE